MGCFLKQRDFGEIKDLINEELLRISGTRRARSMPEHGAGLRTRPIKCEHTVSHYSFIDKDTNDQSDREPVSFEAL